MVELIESSQDNADLSEAIANKTYHAAGGALMYVISGRKPE